MSSAEGSLEIYYSCLVRGGGGLDQDGGNRVQRSEGFKKEGTDLIRSGGSSDLQRERRPSAQVVSLVAPLEVILSLR